MTQTKRTSLARMRLARLAGSLRDGLPGDGTPIDVTEAARRCPHKLIVTTLHGPDGRHRFSASRHVELLGEHRCIGGWLL